MSNRVAPTLEVGTTVRVPFRLHSGQIEVDCVLLDSRTAFGRSEWLIVPVTGGNEPAWVQEATILGDNKGANLTTKGD